MYRPLALFLGLRYSRARRSSGFVSFISAASIMGIALGVMALILGLSAMNGFERELRARVLAVVPHAETEIVPGQGEIPDWQQAEQEMAKTPGVLAVAPLIRLNGLLERGDKLKAVQLRAVLPAAESQISAADSYMTGSGLEALKPGANGVILGKTIADKLGVALGDSITLLLPDVADAAAASSAMKSPLQRRFKVVGFMEIGGQLDGMLGFIHLADAQQVLGIGDKVQGFSFKVTDLM